MNQEEVVFRFMKFLSNAFSNEDCGDNPHKRYKLTERLPLSREECSLRRFRIAATRRPQLRPPVFAVGRRRNVDVGTQQTRETHLQLDPVLFPLDPPLFLSHLKGTAKESQCDQSVAVPHSDGHDGPLTMTDLISRNGYLTNLFVTCQCRNGKR